MPAKNAWNARQSWVHKPGTELIKANQQGTIHKAALKTTKAPNCTPVIPVTQRSRDNSGTSPSDVLPQLIAKWQQRPETPALISRHHTSSSHDASINAVILQRNGSGQGQTTHSGAEQHHPPGRLPPAHQQHKHHQRDRPTFLIGQ